LGGNRRKKGGYKGESGKKTREKCKGEKGEGPGQSLSKGSVDRFTKKKKKKKGRSGGSRNGEKEKSGFF